MYTEEFILIPKRMLTQPAKSEIFDNLFYKQKATQLSLIQRNMFQTPEKSEKEDGAVQTEPSINVETVHEEKDESMSEIEPIVKKKYNYNISVNNERFGSDGEKENRKSRNHSQQDNRIPDDIH